MTTIVSPSQKEIDKISAYRTIDIEIQTLEALKIRKLFNLLVLASKKALSYLVFKGCEQV